MAQVKDFPEQAQAAPGEQAQMHPQPEVINEHYRGSRKLEGKIALITGGDSGIGRSVAVHFAREGADVAIIYLNEDEDAQATKQMVEHEDRECLLIKGDLRDEAFCKRSVAETFRRFNGLNIIVNNAAVQKEVKEIEEISADQLKETFETNIYPFFYIVKEAMPHLHKGDCIINTASITAYQGSEHLLDYSTTKGAIVTFTRSLAGMVAKKGIRVNGVAPGPIWTPLIVSSLENISEFGKDTPMGRAGQPSEVAPAYVYLASNDSSYVTGQIIHVNGGEAVGG